MADLEGHTSSKFQRYWLPGLAFKAGVIGGGYATGRELAEFFLPHGPAGGLAAMLLAMVIWSTVCALTFALAFQYKTLDYQSFFKVLLGPGWIIFEFVYLGLLILILSVFGAAAGAIGAAMFGLPLFVGALALAVAITLAATFGNEAVEAVFKWVSFILYGTYAVLIVLALTTFGDKIGGNFVLPPLKDGLVQSGYTYAAYNLTAAVIILPVLRHLTSRRDALVAGAIAGPLAMIPAMLFFVSMVAFYPEIADATLPSDYVLTRLNQPIFHFIFQFMIFAALLESGVGTVHGLNQRINHVVKARRNRDLHKWERTAITVVLLAICMIVADRVGLIALIGQGYRWLGVAITLSFIVPLITYGLWLLIKNQTPVAATPTPV